MEGDSRLEERCEKNMFGKKFGGPYYVGIS